MIRYVSTEVASKLLILMRAHCRVLGLTGGFLCLIDYRGCRPNSCLTGRATATPTLSLNCCHLIWKRLWLSR